MTKGHYRIPWYPDRVQNKLDHLPQKLSYQTSVQMGLNQAFPIHYTVNYIAKNPQILWNHLHHPRGRKNRPH